MKELALIAVGGVIVWVLMHGGSLMTISPGSATTPMSVPLASGLQKFANALSASGPAPQPPTLNDVQGVVPASAGVSVQPFVAASVAPAAAPAAIQPAPNYVNPAAVVGKNDFTNPNSEAYKAASAAAAKANAAYIVLTPPSQGTWANADTSAPGYAQNSAAVQGNIAAGAQVRVEVQQATGDKWLYSPAGWFRCILIQGVDKIQGTINDSQLWFSLPLELRQKAVSLCSGG